MSNFITNDKTKNLKKRITALISKSQELKFLVGFFYFSGIEELYQALKENPSVTLKILVGLSVDKTAYGLIEIENNAKSNQEIINNYLNSVRIAINSENFDNKSFYQQAQFFLDLIKQERLIIRKTSKPNHAKLYIFELQQDQVSRNKLFITGSSNLTRRGLTEQEEFNVEISDYGVDEAEEYFEQLWESAVEITEDDVI